MASTQSEAAAGGTVPGDVTGTLSLADGGVWTAGAVFLGGVVSVGSNGFGGIAANGEIDVAASPSGAPTTLEAAAIILGGDGDNPDAAAPSYNGTLDVTGGSQIDTSGLSFFDGSHVTIDGTSSIVLGSAAAQAGALVVAGGATLSAITGNIFGNVVLNGEIDEAPFFYLYEDYGDRFQIDGALTGNGTVQAGDSTAPGIMLEIGDASAFTGTLALAPGQLLLLDRGDAPLAALTMTDATVDLLSDAFTGAAPSYDPASGLLSVGTATLHVGPGLAGSDFSTAEDFAGGTMVIGRRLPTWQANSAGPAGDWGDTSHWSTGDLPLSTDTVQIGPGISADTAWTVTVANRVVTDLTLGMGLGTLVVGGGLSLENMLSLDSGTLLSGVSGQVGAPAFDQSGGMLDVSGGAFFTTYGLLDGSATDTVESAGSLVASELQLGYYPSPSSDTLDVIGATLTVQDTLALGALQFGQTATDVTGALSLTDAAVASAGFLTLSPGSSLLLDASSALTVGTGSSVAGAGSVLVLGTIFAIGSASVTGNLVDQGTVFLGVATGSAGTAGGEPTVAGSLSGGGTLEASTDVEIGSAAGFTGILEIEGELTLDSGAAPAGLVEFLPDSRGPAMLDLRGVTWSGASATYDVAVGLVFVGSTRLQVGPAQNPELGTPVPVASFAAAPDGFGGTLITAALVACYAAGTRILAAAGEVAVEALRPGDVVRTHSGRLAPVVWVGRTRIDLARHPAPEHAAPIRVAAGAMAPGLPHRDLLVSPDHALLVDGLLVPARLLVNGATIRPETAPAEVTYVHVELDRHDLLLAEGVPAESYLDTGNRGLFAAEAGVRPLFPEFGADIAASARAFAERGCAPLVLDGPRLLAATRRLHDRAAALGHRSTQNPGLRVRVGDRALAAAIDGPRWRVALPAGTEHVRLTSRTWVPAQRRAGDADARRLGVAIARLWLDGREASLHSPGLGAGWHAPEPQWRWTDGEASLSLAGARALAFEVAMTGAYWLAPSRQRVANRRLVL